MKSSTLPLSSALPEIGLSLPTFWIKELRVTLPIALGGALCMLLSGIFSNSPVYLVFHFAYPVICSAIVAMAFGHDYTYRTNVAALALPISRQKIWWTRIGLCVALLVPIGLLDLLVINSGWLWPWLSGREVRLANPWYIMLAQWLPIAFGPIFVALTLAPGLTILSRSPLFGTIVSMGMPFAISRLLALFYPATHPFVLIYHSWTINAVCILSAILSYRLFVTQEAVDTDASGFGKRPRKLDQSASVASPALKLTRPAFQLLKKEVMLQRFPIAISLLLIAIISITPKEHAELLPIIFPAIIVLIGAIASADERRMGIVPSQVLHPIPFHRQWLIKITAAYGIALMFAIALPLFALLLKTNELQKLTFGQITFTAPFIAGGTLLILSIALYISSISENALRAVLVSFFALIMSLIAIGATVNAFMSYVWRESSHHVVFSGLPAGSRATNVISLEPQLQTFAVAALGFVALALYFAMKNHRYIERSGPHLLRQAAALIAYSLAAVAAISYHALRSSANIVP